MSLFCGECELDIEFGTPLRAVTTAGASVTHAVCDPCVKKIPAKERKNRRKVQVELTFKAATSTRNFNGAYTWRGFRSGNALFSISDKVARQYFPKLARKFLGTDTTARTATT